MELETPPDVALSSFTYMIFEEVKKNTVTKPVRFSEYPSQLAARVGAIYADTLSDEHKKRFGQFFTPLEIGLHLASLTTYKTPNFRLLDPGFGTGVLACCLIRLVN